MVDLFFNEEGKRAENERKKRFLHGCFRKQKKEKRERDEEEARDASSSSSAGGLFFTENDEKHEFQDFEH